MGGIDIGHLQNDARRIHAIRPRKSDIGSPDMEPRPPIVIDELRPRAQQGAPADHSRGQILHLHYRRYPLDHSGLH